MRLLILLLLNLLYCSLYLLLLFIEEKPGNVLFILLFHVTVTNHECKVHSRTLCFKSEELSSIASELERVNRQLCIINFNMNSFLLFFSLEIRFKPLSILYVV